MRILIIHTKYMEMGGEDSVVDSEMQLLKDNGHTVKLLFFNNKNHTWINFFLLPFNPFSYVKVKKEVRKFRPDVVHIHNLHFTASQSIIWAISSMHVPIVRTLHNYRMLCPSGTLYHNGKIYLKSLHTTFPWRAIFDKVYRHSLPLTFWLSVSIWLHKYLGTFKKVNRYITINENSRSIFLDSDLHLASEQIITKPNFINPHIVKEVYPRQDHFLYIGRLSPEKGIDVLIKAFSTNGLALRIIGDGPMRDAILKLQAINPLVTWLGFQDKERIDAELQQCTALIVPSVCLEGMPLTIVEGFAAGTAVIASNLGAMATIVTDKSDGLLFAPNDAVSLNNRLHQWLHLSPTEKHEYGARAVCAYKSKYTPQTNLRALLSIYGAAIEDYKTDHAISYVPSS